MVAIYARMHGEVSADFPPDGVIGLGDAAVGCDFRIGFLCGPASEQLRMLGFCESLHVRKMAHGRNVICSVSGTRLALSRELANQVRVLPLNAA